MPSTIELGQAALATWREAIADWVAPPAADRTPWSEEQLRAAIGAVFFALATYYVISSVVRMIRAARA
jgi:hypothetical protein